MDVQDRDRDFGDFVDARAVVMRRTAYLLCGEWDRAEDLVQTALAKMYAVWPRISKFELLDAYARKVLVRTAIDESRLAFRRRETAVDSVPDWSGEDADVADKVDVRAALATLPPRQREVVVLRYWEDLSIEETSQLLGCSSGTVKSQAAKGLAALRRHLEPAGEVR
jgi:RNA polymerase sigma-70 factor (sigma-E family)